MARLPACGPILSTFQYLSKLRRTNKARKKNAKPKGKGKDKKKKDFKLQFTQAINQLLSTTLRTFSPKVPLACSRDFKNKQLAVSAATNLSQHLLITIIPVQSGETPLNNDQARGQSKDDKAMPTNAMQANTVNQWSSLQ